MVEEYPRVLSLTYQLWWDFSHDYEQSAALDGQLRDFDFQLRHRKAVFTPKVRFETEHDAHRSLAPQLIAWELDAAIKHGEGALEFKYLGADVRNKALLSGEKERLACYLVLPHGRETVTEVFSVHPRPPQGFAIDDFAHTLCELFLVARGTPLTLLYVAYSGGIPTQVMELERVLLSEEVRERAEN